MGLIWVIKIDCEPGGSRWRVHMWIRNLPEGGRPSSKEPISVTHPNERTAREWAERIATSWEQQGTEWEIDEESL
jgi:hypothetical protein